MDTKVTLYISNDDAIASFLNDDDLCGFIEYLKDEPYFDYEVKEFNSQDEASKFCEGLCYNQDERAPLDKMILWSNYEGHTEYINVLKIYDEGNIENVEY